MPKYIILRRKKDDPKIHTPGSLEETACEIVNDCFRLTISKEQLMALPADGAAATMALLNGDAICLKRKISNSSSFNELLNGGAISVYSSIGDTDVDALLITSCK